MKIAILTKKIGITGIDKNLCSIANMLSYNHDVELIQVYKEEKQHDLNENIKKVYLLDNDESEGKRNAFQKLFLKIKVSLLQKMAVKKQIKRKDVDVFITSNRVQVKWYKYNKKNKYKIFIENEYHLDDNKTIKKIKKLTKHTNYILTVSKEIRDYYREKLNKVCHHMPNVLDDIPVLNTDFNTNNIVTVGRLTSDKGLLDLIDMYYQVQLEFPDVTLDIIGDGPELNKIKKKIFDLRIKEKVNLHGRQDKDYINNILSHSSIFALTSKKESFGLALLEAMSFGIPSVVFDSASGVLEFMEDNSNGYIIKNRDIEEMARKVKMLLNSNEFKFLIGNKAKETAREYSFESLMKRWNEFINSIVNNQPFDEVKIVEEVQEDIYKKTDIQSLLAQIADKDNQEQDTSNLLD